MKMKRLNLVPILKIFIISIALAIFIMPAQTPAQTPAGGLSAKLSDLWHQDVADIAGIPGERDFFGYSVAIGDFNGDGFADLAIGVRRKDVEDISDAGAVQVIYGSGERLSADDNELWHQDVEGIEGMAEEDDRFGRSLASGDFNGDGFDDLAIGVPGEYVEDISNAGAVNVIYGSADGLSADDNELWNQDVKGIKGTAEGGDAFGISLASGDFNGDGFDELAIGVPYEDVEDISDAGAVNVIYGSADGLSADKNDLWHQGIRTMVGTAEESDTFGRSLASGDFNGDGFDELAIGVPYEDVEDISDAGAVHVIYGSADGLIIDKNDLWHQDVEGIGGTAGKDDAFGDSLASGDFNGDGFADLAIGVPGEDVEDIPNAGAVHVIYGSADRLSADQNKIWHHDVEGIEGTAGKDDYFGFSLASGDFNGDSVADLAIGVPYTDIEDISNAGAVHVIYGSENDGLSAEKNGLWHQDVKGIEGMAEEWDGFGFSLASGDLDANDYSDLAIGVPFKSIDNKDTAGAAIVLYGKAEGGGSGSGGGCFIESMK